MAGPMVWPTVVKALAVVTEPCWSAVASNTVPSRLAARTAYVTGFAARTPGERSTAPRARVATAESANARPASSPGTTDQRTRGIRNASRAVAWKRRSCGPGAKGERVYDWAVATLPDSGTADAGFTRWLLIRRSITKPTELAYYLCHGPTSTTDEELIRVAGTRWAIEECSQTAKGLDEYQVRRYDAWYRHITLAMLAHAYLAVTAAVAGKDVPDPTATGSSRSPSPKFDVCWHT
jgi:hypothetical protein